MTFFYQYDLSVNGQLILIKDIKDINNYEVIHDNQINK